LPTADGMRLGAVLVLLALAGVLAGSAAAYARPVTAADRALLARPATPEEKIAERVAERLTGHANVSVRCGDMGISDPNIETPTYWSAQCKDGGKYDLRPASHAWPS